MGCCCPSKSDASPQKVPPSNDFSEEIAANIDMTINRFAENVVQAYNEDFQLRRKCFLIQGIENVTVTWVIKAFILLLVVITLGSKDEMMRSIKIPQNATLDDRLVSYIDYACQRLVGNYANSGWVRESCGTELELHVIERILRSLLSMIVVAVLNTADRNNKVEVADLLEHQDDEAPPPTTFL